MPMQLEIAASPQTGPLAFAIRAERPSDKPFRERLLDAAMGPARKRKSSEKLRRGRLPAEGMAFVATLPDGTVAGTVRLWHVGAGNGPDGSPVPALLLGPLACDVSLKGLGIGTALMQTAMAAAARSGCGAVLLVGDHAYYARFGFRQGLTDLLAMPGPYERERFLAAEIVPGHLAEAQGVLTAAGGRSHGRLEDASRLARIGQPHLRQGNP